MHSRLLAAAGAALVLFLAPAVADAACCDQKAGRAAHEMKAGCCDMPCCAEKAGDPTIVVRFLEFDPQLEPQPPVRQVAEVWFHRPTWVGKAILQGRYVIEHDNDRMARGEPCTHIYAHDDQKHPVATFHCTHLERDRAGKNLVVVYTTHDGWQKLAEFQFAGETASHGYPTVR